MIRNILVGLSIAAIAYTTTLYAQSAGNNPQFRSSTRDELTVSTDLANTTADRGAVGSNRYYYYSRTDNDGRHSGSRQASVSKELTQRDRQLERETRSYVAALARSVDSRKDKEITDRLEKTVKGHFELKQEIRGLQLVELEERVQQLRDLHQRREAAKLSIIEKRVRQLTDEAKGLGWNDVSTSSRSTASTPWMLAAPELDMPTSNDLFDVNQAIDTK